MNSFQKYDTVTASNAGVKMQVKDAAGKDTEDWIHVLGIDSAAFQTASRNMRQKILAFLEDKGLSGKETTEYANLIIEQQRTMQSALVTGWSFDEPCNVDNVLELFRVAPYIAEQVEAHASKRGLFVKV